MRNGWRPGRYLIEDDESGKVVYDDQVAKIWDGSIREKRMYETRQPQEFVRGKNDPKVLTETRPAAPTAIPTNTTGPFVGNTTIPVPQGPAFHLYDFGIGEMTVGINFVVR